ncbi:MAG: hypothetical protein KU37_10340 [Sulfuricurvum sp. PC08-66]|nr:MAG: hypothetical protein KU37_10340 [Sulfuricurvum sp. PC08-66]
MTWIAGCSKHTQPHQFIIDENIPQITRFQSIGDISAIALEWEPNHDPMVKGYNIYRQRQESEEAQFVRIASINDRFVSHYVDKNLPSEQKYLYQITAFNEKGQESKPSQIIPTITRPIFKSVVYITGIDMMPRKAKLIWRPHQNERISGYVVERKEPSEKEWRVVATLTHRYTVEYIDSYLKDNTTYMYRLKAVTFDNLLSTPSDIVTVTTKPLPTPIIEVNTTTELPQKIRLEWAKHTQKDISHYNIYRSNESKGSFGFLAKRTTPLFTDEIKEHGKGYFYQVSAVDFDGLESMRTQEWYGQSIARPNSPQSLNYTQEGNVTTLTWQKGDPRTRAYRINIQEKTGWFSLKNTQHEQTTTTFVYTQQTNTPTTYSVEAIDEYNISSISAVTTPIVFELAKPQ